MKKNKSPLAFIVLFVGFWSLITLIFDGMIAFNVYRQFKAKGFPVATGTITHSEVTVHQDDDGSTYGVEVKYTFQVGAVRHEGTRYRYGQMNSSDDSARRIVDSLPVGKQVDVHYNPADPSDAVLVVGVQPSDLFMALFLTPFNLVMLGGWYAGLNLFFPGIGRLMTGSPRAIGRGFKRRLVLEPAPRLLPAAAVLGITSFLSIFVVAFGFGFNPPMAVIQVVWGIVLGLAGAMLIRRPGFSVRGSGLEIDDVENLLTISDANQKKPATVVPLASVIDVNSAPRGDGYQVQLTYSDDDRAERHKTLIHVGDSDRAESLAGWVKEQVLRSARA